MSLSGEGALELLATVPVTVEVVIVLMALKVVTVATYAVVVTAAVSSVTSTVCSVSGRWPEKEHAQARVDGSTGLKIL